MEPASRMVHLTTVMGSFHARVVEARLAAEGVGVALRGMDEGIYPLAFPVDVLVVERDLQVAREILLADAVDAAFGEERPPAGRPPQRHGRRGDRRRVRWRGAR